MKKSNQSLDTYFAKYLKEMENIKSSSPLTLKAYLSDFTQSFGKNFLIINDENLSNQAIEAQKKWRNLSPASKNRKVSMLKSFFHYLYRQGVTQTDLAHRLITPKVHQKLPHFISVDEVLSVIESFSSGSSSADHQLLFYLLYGSGLRVSEACNLKWTNLQFSQRTMMITGKGNKERIAVLSAAALKLLKSSEHKGENFIWGKKALNPRTAYAWVKDMGARAGLVKPLHPHALRHSFATHILSGGANIRVLQELLGHSSLTATQKYTHLSLDDLSRSMEKNHPLEKSSSKR